MSNKVDWKVGDRVLAVGDMQVNEGVVTRLEDNKVWATWTNVEDEKFFYPEDSVYFKLADVPNEEQAVKLLLSLGYTLKKG
jgi:hypothetical protein